MFIWANQPNNPFKYRLNQWMANSKPDRLCKMLIEGLNVTVEFPHLLLFNHALACLDAIKHNNTQASGQVSLMDWKSTLSTCIVPKAPGLFHEMLSSLWHQLSLHNGGEVTHQLIPKLIPWISSTLDMPYKARGTMDIYWYHRVSKKIPHMKAIELVCSRGSSAAT